MLVIYMKKVLVISFYWPPSGKASMHWPLKMVKHLPESGWQPYVVTVKDDTFTSRDESSLHEVSPDVKVLRTNFLDPFTLYKKFLGKAPDQPLVASEALSKTNKNLRHRLSLWIRMNLFIPDARAGWYPPAVREIGRLMKNEKFDAIITNGPPHTTHLIGKKLSKKFNIPLLSVFIDPWVDISYYKGQKRSAITFAIDKKLERAVMEQSSQVVVVTETLREYFVDKYPFLKDKIHVLYWGYNEDAFSGCNKTDSNEKVMLHAGNIYDFQNVPKFWKTLKAQLDKGTIDKLRFIGTVGPAIKKSIEEAGISNKTEYMGFLSYPDAVKQMCNAKYLFVCATEPRHVPGKLFEYLRTGNPILAFGDDNQEVKKILQETNAGMLFRYNDEVDEFFEKADSLHTNLDTVKQNFDREIIAKKLSSILNNIDKTQS